MTLKEAMAAYDAAEQTVGEQRLRVRTATDAEGYDTSGYTISVTPGSRPFDAKGTVATLEEVPSLLAAFPLQPEGWQDPAQSEQPR